MTIRSESAELPELPTLTAAEVIAAASEVFDGNDMLAADALGGGSNPDVYRVAGDAGSCVMKFFPAGSLQARFEAESIGRATKAGLPVPAVYGQDTLVTESGPRPWLAMESIDSEATLATVPLTIDERTTVLRSLGVYLAQLHTETMDGYWKPTADGWTFDDWSVYWGNVGNDLLVNSGRLIESGLSTSQIDSVLARIAEYQQLPPDRSVFCNADLRPAHVYLGDDADILSIIDWGAGQANGPERDFSKPLVDGEEPMLAAYAAASGMPRAELDERVRYMRLAHLPGLVVFNHKKGRMDAAAQRAQEVGRLLSGADALSV